MKDSAFLEFRDVSKHFGGVQALHNVTITIQPREVHAVLGQNGAGKSTLVKVLGGAVRPDAGEIWLNGRRIEVQSPVAAMRLGITVVHQELTLLPDLTVWENVAAGALEITPFRTVDRRKTMRKVGAVLERLGVEMELERRVDELSLAQQQLVEIARALYLGGAVLVLDEPNSALAGQETEILLGTVRSLADSGTTVILVSHRLEEVFSVSDQATVLRDGEVQGTWRIAATDIATVIHAMVGDVREPLVPPLRADEDRRVALELKEVRIDRVGPISIRLYQGEILGLAGLEGSGVDTVMRAAAGVVSVRSGIEIDGKPAALRRPADAIERGVVYVPPDRKTQGLWLDRSVNDNLVAGRLDLVSTLRILRRSLERRHTASWTERLRIGVANPRDSAHQLSGGNQQRLLLGRSLAMEPKVILLSDPTRGVDVKAKAEIHGLLQKLALDGFAVCFSSSELKEVLTLANRIVCLHRGLVTAEGPAETFSEHRLLQLAAAS